MLIINGQNDKSVIVENETYLCWLRFVVVAVVVVALAVVRSVAVVVIRNYDAILMTITNRLPIKLNRKL